MSDPSRGPSSGKAPSARPRQLTMAAGFVIGGSVFLLLTVFDTLTTLNSIEMRDEITKMLRSPTGEGLGITMSQALTSMRVGLMIAGACAAATAVLGVYVLKPNRGARLALSILAVPILLTAPLTGGITGALVVVATLMLWSGPARDWFAGRPVREMQVPGRPDKPSKQGPWETTMPPQSDRPHRPDQTPPPGQDPVAPADPPSDQEVPGIGPPHQRPSSRPRVPPRSPALRPGSGFARLRSTTSRRAPGRRPPRHHPPGSPGVVTTRARCRPRSRSPAS